MHSNVLQFHIGETGLNSDGSLKSIPFTITQPPAFSTFEQERVHIKQQLALAFRIFAKLGFEEGVAGHISIRDPEIKDSYWVNPFGKPFSRLRPSDLLWVSEKGEKLNTDAKGILGAGAFSLHASIHKHRANANAVTHAHSMFGRTFSTLGVPLLPITQDACAFYERHAIFSEFDGIPADTVIGHRIAETLGPLANGVIMQNHGLLTVGETLQESIFWFVSMDRCCHSQMLSMSTGLKPIAIAHDAASSARDLVGNPTMGWFSAQPMFEKAAEENPDVFL
ncbi:class II aldolase/adducin N-terminal [Chytriomyces sp. MP71]|nr:class II aldolase/adducin N-terminal [Chytriomyces sp. MP71]